MWNFSFFSLLLLGAPGDPVPVEDLSLVLQLPIREISRDEYPADTLTAGDYFKYFAPQADTNAFGLLIPINDQSCTGERCSHFASYIDKGRVAEDVAGSIVDKVDQLRRMEAWGGPRLISLAIIVEPLDPSIRELGLLVEHLEGRRIARLDENRSPEEKTQFLELFDGISREGWLPFDYKASNLLISPETGFIRPVDAVLTTPAEIQQIRGLNFRLYRFRMLQLAQSVIAIRKSSSDSLALLNRCRDQVERMNSLFPDNVRYQKGVLQTYEPTPVEAFKP